MEDIMRGLCVKQGYVPSTCTMDGKLCFALVNSHGDPCRGCNEDRSVCKGRSGSRPQKELVDERFTEKQQPHGARG